MDGRPDSDDLWGSGAADDLVEQGRGGSGPGWPGRPRGPWRVRPPGGPVRRAAAWLAAGALAAGLLGGYLAGYRAGSDHRGGQIRTSRSSPPLTAESFGLAETGSTCSDPLGGGRLQTGIEVVNGSGTAVRLGPLTARFPRGGLKLTGAVWGPCGTLPFAHSGVGGVLPFGASTWLSVIVTTAGGCPDGLPVEYVASYGQHGQTFTVALPGFVDLASVRVDGCPGS
ncbi:MAG TPA: hypothetical protein VGD68_15950 [Streptosporangiaceae bacterium]